MKQENSRFELCLNWLMMVAATGLASFAVGMLFARAEFQFMDFLASMSPGVITAILIGTVFYFFWFLSLVRRTLGKRTLVKDRKNSRR